MDDKTEEEQRKEFLDLAKNLLSSRTKGSYTLVKALTANVFKLRANKTGRARIMKIILDRKHPLYDLGLTFNPSERSVYFHRFLANRGFAPKVFEHFKIKGGFVIIMEFIPGSLSQKDLDDPGVCNAIDGLIKNIHGLEIAHGDLHTKNIKYRKEFTWDVKTDDITNSVKVYVIDCDVSFRWKEYDEEEFPKRWLEYGFDITDGGLGEFLEHERTNYKILVDDDDM